MRAAISETDRRREIQLAYNERARDHGRDDRQGHLRHRRVPAGGVQGAARAQTPAHRRARSGQGDAAARARADGRWSSRRRCWPPPRSCASSTPRSCATSCASCAATCRRSAAEEAPEPAAWRARQARLRPATWPRMAAVDFDRQAIERRDFPIGRRGYDPAAVDAHLRALAGEFEELQRAALRTRPDLSLASTAGTQVQSILEAAEAAAAEIERQARQDAAARRARTAEPRRRADPRGGDRDRRARTSPPSRRRRRCCSSASARWTARCGALVESLRAGAGRLAGDLAAVEANMGELYDAASGRGRAAGGARGPGRRGRPAHGRSERSDAQPRSPPASPEPPRRPRRPPPPAPQCARCRTSRHAGAPRTGDLDGARLVALNMALNGESRADTERYLAENFAPRPAEADRRGVRGDRSDRLRGPAAPQPDRWPARRGPEHLFAVIE